jgi:hypothetical protein
MKYCRAHKLSRISELIDANVAAMFRDHTKVGAAY